MKCRKRRADWVRDEATSMFGLQCYQDDSVKDFWIGPSLSLVAQQNVKVYQPLYCWLRNSQYTHFLSIPVIRTERVNRWAP